MRAGEGLSGEAPSSYPCFAWAPSFSHFAGEGRRRGPAHIERNVLQCVSQSIRDDKIHPRPREAPKRDVCADRFTTKRNRLGAEQGTEARQRVRSFGDATRADHAPRWPPGRGLSIDALQIGQARHPGRAERGPGSIAPLRDTWMPARAAMPLGRQGDSINVRPTPAGQNAGRAGSSWGAMAMPSTSTSHSGRQTAPRVTRTGRPGNRSPRAARMRGSSSGSRR